MTMQTVGQMYKGRNNGKRARQIQEQFRELRMGKSILNNWLCEYKIADLIWELKCRFGLVVKLKAINHYERFFCYLTFLPLLYSLLII